MHLAIDIGGTKTLLALFAESGRVMKRVKFATAGEPEKFMKVLAKNLREFFPARSPRTLDNVVVAIAAEVDGETFLAPCTWGRPVRYGNLPWGEQFDFSGEITACIKKLFTEGRVRISGAAPLLSVHGKLEYCPIYILNDANLAAYFEAKKMRGTSVYLTFSTGIGGGIMRDGKLLPRSNGFEPGHDEYTWKGVKMEYEDIASANALRDAYGVIATDLRGREAYQDIALRVSTGLASVIRTVRPDTVIIGGALGFQLKNFRKYLEPVLAVSLHRSVEELPRIVAAKYPLESVIYGCYLYGKEKD